jgi:hypothetical protein
MSLRGLQSRLKSATGASDDLDKLIAKALNVGERHYSSSVDDCIELIHELFPNAHWHLGRAADGVSMYATIEGNGHREESSGVTIPLVLLSVIVAHLEKH